MYLQGIGVRKAPGQGIAWLRKAASKGHPRAMYYLGEAYASGAGGRKNQPAALKQYRKAAALGDADALKRLREAGERS
jgi:TPR repeat protein